MQKKLLALLFILYFTGCVERGQNLKPTPAHATASKNTPIIPVKPAAKPTINVQKPKLKSDTLKNVVVEQENIKVKPEEVETKIITPIKTSQPTNTNIYDSFLNLSDETKNNISGFLILAIGVIILL